MAVEFSQQHFIFKLRAENEQAKEVGTIKWVFFEGGKPFLYYPILMEGVREASRLGFQVGILSNCY